MMAHECFTLTNNYVFFHGGSFLEFGGKYPRVDPLMECLGQDNLSLGRESHV